MSDCQRCDLDSSGFKFRCDRFVLFAFVFHQRFSFSWHLASQLYSCVTRVSYRNTHKIHSPVVRDGFLDLFSSLYDLFSEPFRTPKIMDIFVKPTRCTFSSAKFQKPTGARVFGFCWGCRFLTWTLRCLIETSQFRPAVTKCHTCEIQWKAQKNMPNSVSNKIPSNDRKVWTHRWISWYSATTRSRLSMILSSMMLHIYKYMFVHKNAHCCNIPRA